MTLQTVVPVATRPNLGGILDRFGAGFNDNILNADTEYCALVFPAPDAATVDHVGFSLKTVQTNSTLDVTIQTVSTTTGLPNGLVSGSTTDSLSLVTTDDERWYETSATDLNAALTKGEIYAIVLTLNGAGDVDIGRMTNWKQNLPYSVLVGTTLSTSIFPMTIKYDDDSYGDLAQFGVPGVENGGVTQFDAADNPDHIGNLIKFEEKARVKAASVNIDMVDSAATFRVKFYQDTSLTATPTLKFTSQTYYADVLGGGGVGVVKVQLDTTYTIAAGDYCRVVVEALHASNRIGMWRAIFDSSANRALACGENQYTSSNGGTTFAETNTEFVHHCALICDQLDDGAGGGSGGFGIIAGVGGLAS